MRLDGIREDDIVRVDIKGKPSFAKVREVLDDGLRISARAVNNGHETHTTVTSRQVVEHYSKRGRPRQTRRGEVLALGRQMEVPCP